MKLDRFTFRTQEALENAQSIAEENHQSEITPEHLLFALIEQKDGIGSPLLKKVGADTNSIKQS